MRVGISCCTPYHIFNAINIKVNKYSNDSVDIYVSNRFNNSEVIYENIKMLNLFDNVYYVNDNHLNKFVKLGIGIYYKSFLGEAQCSKKYSNDYDEFYISCYSPFNKCFSAYLKQRFATKIYFAEDGTSTYTLKENIDNIGSIKRYIDKFNSSIIDEYLLYKPELLCVDYGKKVSKMPKLVYKNRVTQYLKTIFGIEEYTRIFTYKKFIYLDQKFDSGIDYNIQGELFDIIKNNVDKDKLIVKMHPREKIDKYEGITIYEKTIPWELILLLEELKGENVFITISSTSALANALLFGNKTRIIFLYKLVGYEEKTGDKNFSRYIDKAKNIEELEIYIPNSFKELQEILIQLNSNS